MDVGVAVMVPNGSVGRRPINLPLPRTRSVEAGRVDEVPWALYRASTQVQGEV